MDGKQSKQDQDPTANMKKNYKATEGEALAVAIALERCKHYVQGTPITIITDHKPLEGIEKGEITEKTSARIMRIKERWLPFNISIKYIAGEDNTAADALSRHIKDSEMKEEEDPEDENKKEHQCNCVIEGVTEEVENRIRLVQREDKDRIINILKTKKDYLPALEAIRQQKKEQQ